MGENTGGRRPRTRGHTDYERFTGLVDTAGGPDECHPWVGTRRNGYGEFRIGRKKVLPHRWLLGYLRGEPLGPDEEACHHCDNPPCCNPKHLYAGSHAQNMRDMAERGRHGRPYSKKTECPAGHPYNEENTRWRKGGGRACRTCDRARCATYKASRSRPMKRATCVFCERVFEYDIPSRQRTCSEACRVSARRRSSLAYWRRIAGHRAE